ncbi:dihydroneopterin aldolase/2-amino-4-hydroxy-6-hydroxymethyldihydropteridine diphosphokinase [Clostridium tetanomorphum]|uniref:Bifunctional folate synthesis protein n=1 Tax=Clostridium tetanomorphum TaxID=1553 RepID=A0A923E4M4_CLOTT|nr:2-amino-4-hydroxy-6-hydroxymethyldihydropteridine diphosphokinase [Clostridium tetanomorphum]MBC2396345.1 2-amino-4-hydroxy-6-hydroxymethyldihydropteridine diphosphokinase [Clostridium tetanomorphum]MBP1863426.1 dihydroneopterin aldolase/2-amino-4-hydroxy-6-hydroxymethyldihydropteridine diphosphokinase [Clostridium tetanomorphum]NRS83523.1 dihydroneopterin aldolase/2-amino-4-hydroxy-6-hydroxymethyldihydropteridine diphosphokinase [Clostridium tetanomorphum]NRZ96723.1 dihydroneopterin aldolas
MDKIIVKDFEIFANHGVFGEEKVLGQKFIVSLELQVSTREAALTGDLTKSVHYGELCHKIEKEIQKESYDLIETVAEKIAEFVLIEYPLVKGVKVNLKKPWAPILRHLEYVAVEIYRKRSRAFIALGSNMGDKEKNLLDAIEKIKDSNHTQVKKVSSFITTEPWGYLDQEEFLNGAIEVDTILQPKELVRFLLNIEEELKRKRVIKWGPRTIDLDVVLYDDLITEDEEILLPHPRMQDRMFVLEPLAEIAPYIVHPLLHKRVIQLKEELQNREEA